MTHKHKKRCSNSQGINEMKIKTMRYCFIPIRGAKLENQKVASDDEN